MSRNLFDQLPICVCHLQNLETLSLKYNKLVNLPTDAETLINLKVWSIPLNHKILALWDYHEYKERKAEECSTEHSKFLSTFPARVTVTNPEFNFSGWIPTC